jgi:predicted ATPase/class 3 adenylate cyclase
LDEFRGAGWADREATRLEALHLQAKQRRYDALMELDRARAAAAELEFVVAAHPLDETMWGQFMLALYRSGRQADALRAYQQARHQLADELGIEPGPELVELEHRILDQDPTLAAATDLAVSVGTRRVVGSGAGDRWYPRTFLLTDIVASVSLWERDPESMSQAVARHDTIIRDTVSACGGELVRAKGEGDSTFSVFVHPGDAIAAARTLQGAVASEPWDSAVPLRVRAGVHTGDAEPRDGDWYGPAVNRAARLRSLANGNHTLVSGVTAGLVADRLPEGVRLLYRGRRVLRGIERPEEVWELASADDPRLTLSTASVTGLPVPSTRLIGRTVDIHELRGLMDGERLVTLTGPGGSGKTRLALEVARHAEQQGETVWLAELALLSDPDSVPNMVAAAVGLQLDTGDTRGALLAGSAGLAGLLVLDNCEHLLAACAELVGPLLATAPDLKILATSREALELDGERTWPVQPLAVPGESVRGYDELMRIDSVALLFDRVRAIRPDLEIRDDDLTAVRRISRCLDGLPLAIELAAGRLRSISLNDLATHLDEHVLDLTRRRWSTGRTPRHRSLQVALDWSYDLLSESQRTLARRLAVFAGGFRLDAVEATCGRDLDVLDTVDELVAKSMVTFDGTTARYRLLEPIRQYLGERLEESDESEMVRRAHIAWTAALCEELGGRLLVDQRARSIRLRGEWERRSSTDQGVALRRP